jgi:hypothetical protein
LHSTVLRRTTLRDSATDAEQPLIVALRASINSYPATSRETIDDADADPQSPRRHLMHGW